MSDKFNFDVFSDAVVTEVQPDAEAGGNGLVPCANIGQIEVADWKESDSDIRPRKASDDDVFRSLESDRDNCDDWHSLGRDLRFEGQDRGRGEGNVESMLSVTCLDRESAGSQICSATATARSIRQLGTWCGMRKHLIDGLIAGGRFDLLADTFNEVIANPDGRREHLLRLRKNPDGGLVLRAFLPDTFNRLDNIHLHRAIALACRENAQLWLKDVQTDFDSMVWNVMLKDDEIGRRLKGKKVEFEVAAGLRIENSEVGEDRYAGKAMTAVVYIERLICTNGQTTGDERSIRVKDIKVLETGYKNTIPPNILPGDVQKEVNRFVNTLLDDKLKVQVGQAMQFLADQADRLINTPISISGPDDLRLMLRETLKETGLLRLRGVSLDQVMHHVETRHGPVKKRSGEEEAPVSYEGWTAWDIYNVITRYATSLTERGGQRGRFVLGGRLIRSSHRVLDPKLNWSAIRKRATEGAPDDVMKGNYPPAI